MVKTKLRERDIFDILTDVVENWKPTFLDTFYACGGDTKELDTIATAWEAIRLHRKQEFNQ